MKVLVVEDDRDYAALLSRWLGREGFAVETVEDGAEAYARLAGGGFDAAVIDLLLPSVGGAELLHCIRADARLSDLRVVVHTALPITPERATLLAGADVVLEKAGFVLPLVKALAALVQEPGRREIG
ncbi:response regulator [Vulgatibacter sp.]|uniref:response regulator n=1 Tax=Vulgatibacter sp. TaxID=1971226 RepID=UPI0035696279